jgi:hypothetical protein
LAAANSEALAKTLNAARKRIGAMISKGANPGKSIAADGLRNLANGRDYPKLRFGSSSKASPLTPCA